MDVHPVMFVNLLQDPFVYKVEGQSFVDGCERTAAIRCGSLLEMEGSLWTINPTMNQEQVC